MDEETGQSVIDLILDEAQQKGTGKWASQNALDLGAPIPTINAAVESRIISAYKDERVVASQILSGPQPKIDLDPQIVIDAVRDALYAAKICSYAQGFGLMRMASQEYKYQLNYRRDRAHLARRLHHPRALPQRHPPGVCAPTRSAQPADRSGIRAGDECPPGCAAQSGGTGG